ncbi:MAG: site-2 protease family protein [Verrucomicrobia bacterium]|nr:site-2 protease family protein [Verrucomicrobiota bacterium]NBU09896.1 site-2 protease family protein [Pseudomonadota bacterium]NDA68499.1 site-2 protease family protein [Verrucomicrobiota bacterium]NDB77392.1 site-2 protease family protein [Verrucomicrobiota bacterium]NDD40212.1 site-2 protease family protein [Verrucomicrobiota bacterium]
MSQSALFDGLLTYLFFIPLLTFHEWAHAWVAWKCGDDTAYQQGRVTLNPLAHMELIGTVVLPLMGIMLMAADSALAGFIIGWGRPVPVNISNLRRPRLDDSLVALAGPAVNVLLAFALLALAKVGVATEIAFLKEIGIRMALTSLFLCFFNLLPVPPLDGSHVLKNLIGMSHETYWKLCQYGFLAVIIIINIPGVRHAVALATITTLALMAAVLGLR